MNYQKTFGWYYNSSKDRAPAWSGVQYLYNFLIKDKRIGPSAKNVPIHQVEIGDVIQLSFDGSTYGHTLLVVQTGHPVSADNVLIATHSDDSDYRPLSSYTLAKMYRCLKIRVSE